MMNIQGTSWTASTGSEAVRTRVGQSGAASDANAAELTLNDDALSGVTASVVSRVQQNAVPPDNTYGPLKVWSTPITGMDRVVKQEAAKALDATTSGLMSEYKDFKASLKSVAPDLAKLDFGFTVNEKGDLVATGVSGPEKDRLNQLLNQNTDLKSLATRYVSDVLAYAKADGNEGLGRFKLDASSFQLTVDIGEDLDARLNGDTSKSLAFWQILDKGVPDTERLKPVRLV